MAEPTPTPKLEDSPAFQQQTVSALGGNPLNPVKFQSVSTGLPQANGTAEPTPQRRAHTTFDIDPEAEASRAKIMVARGKLGSLVNTIDSSATEVKKIIDALNTKAGKEEAVRQGFDIKTAEKFLTALDEAVEAVKPKQKG